MAPVANHNNGLPMLPVETEGSAFEGSVTEIKQVIRKFLRRVGFRPPGHGPNAKLRAETTAEILSWGADVSLEYVAGLTDTSCTIAESAYAHTSYAHQLIVAIYTAYMVYIDDLGGRNLDALARFSQRLVARSIRSAPANNGCDPAGEAFGDPVLERVVEQFQDMYALYPRVSADAMVVATVDAVVGMYIEFVTQNKPVMPGAARYPWFIRSKAGIGSTYVHLNFMKGWRDPADNSYLQLAGDMEQFTDCINDVLSFYKETLNGETDNYICLRAAAESKDPLVVLRELADETYESIHNVDTLTASDPQLNTIFRSFVMGYIEFHFRAHRYRLDELEMTFWSI
ncbi:terpenoid synthase [Trametes elegans]|nr:terpenoid synthase [Trametes elegans]